jgi:hypothetical protein
MNNTKRKNGFSKRPFRYAFMAIGAVAIGVLTCFLLWSGAFQLLRILEDESWNKESVEKTLRVSLPVDASHIEFDGRRGRGARLDFTFEASYESMDTFVSQFCEGTLYQGYDPFNAIDISFYAKEKPVKAYVITMNDYYPISYYSYSPNTSDHLFGIRCLSPKLGELEVLVDKTSPDVALVKMDAFFTCYKCGGYAASLPENTPSAKASERPPQTDPLSNPTGVPQSAPK